ncbi:MAG TPA: lytic murein transglycosylase B [Gallionella sp.]|nr:lytic murein transglycosylase B [Gallionella sp.]
MKIFRIALVLLAWSLVPHPAYSATLPGIPEFIDEMVVKHQFRRNELENAFAHAQHLPAVIEAISRPATIKPWPEYRAAFVNQKRIKLGLEFWGKYRQTLRRAERKYGVPQEIIIAVIGVETIYGQNAGNFRVLDALTTLAFDYPRRADFFRTELENYLLLARDQQFDLMTIRGSYAGAMGIPQFMPSSYRNYAVDFNGNHKTDLLGEDRDAIGSVANYLQSYGWVRGEPVAVRVQVGEESCLGEIRMPRSFAEWAAAGIVPSANFALDKPARLVDFTVEEGKEFWLVFNNFEVITRYNNSDFYAMSVFQLAEEIKAARKINLPK